MQIGHSWGSWSLPSPDTEASAAAGAFSDAGFTCGADEGPGATGGSLASPPPAAPSLPPPNIVRYAPRTGPATYRCHTEGAGGFSSSCTSSLSGGADGLEARSGGGGADGLGAPSDGEAGGADGLGFGSESAAKGGVFRSKTGALPSTPATPTRPSPSAGSLVRLCADFRSCSSGSIACSNTGGDKR